MSPESPKPTTHTYVVGDLTCFLCGTISGSIVKARQPASGRVWFRKPGELQPVPQSDRLQVRCIRCGGSTYVDDLRTVTRRREPRSFQDLRGRPGRPPKKADGAASAGTAGLADAMPMPSVLGEV